MSSEEHFAPEAHKTDEQLATEQESIHEERETSFSFRREARDGESSTSALGAVEGDIPAAAASIFPAPTGEDEAEAAAVEATTGAHVESAEPSQPARSSRKSRASASGPSAESDEPRKKSRKSTAPEEAEGNANVRLDRLRQALYRFLDLIDHRATSTSFVKALPHIDSDSVEALRQQFVSQLKDAIIDESEKLIESNDLEAKLASLHRLAQEADARYQAGYDEGAEEIKDVWRKEMHLETAISARAIPDQERRVEELRAELEAVRKQNRTIHEELLATRNRSDALRNDARDSLDALESAIKGLEATPDMQNKLRKTMDDLLQDLGARV
ncbi:Nnf1 [Kalmanozyma brasiliensis GHG001]|uniref:Uncharacterized protein n=1 Tax=Kalmanozyma brasiliensis (strain GHG001) TaxID=1365824 RepID=V5EP70_KALBG|nr:Nnf1 [Kalmanozyma brasiliensis GHG001]EST04723.1 Nnf1 [Kalmanozyma brasiliensis GHG001]